MGLAGRIGPRSPAWLALVTVLCAGVGLASAVSPTLGLEVAAGLAFAVAVITNLTIGLLLFTVASFLEVVGSGGAALSFMKVVGLVLFVSWFAASSTDVEQKARSLAAQQPALTMAVIAFVSWSILSIVWAESSGMAATSTERYLLDSLLLPIVFGAIRRRDHFFWIIGAFVFGADISATYGFLASGGGRLSGAVGDPNILASVLIAALLLSAPLIAASPRGSARRFAAIVGCVFAAVGVLYTDSRGGLIALACALLAGVLLGGRWRFRVLVLLVACTAAAGLYITVLAPLSARQHLSSADSSGRTTLWKVGLRMFAAHPITGVGAGNFPVATIHFVQQSGPLTRADLIVRTPKVAHNVYLEILDDLGLPGLLLFLTIVLLSMRATARAAKRYERAGDEAMEFMSRGVLLALIGFMVAEFFLSDEYSKQLWLLLALPAPLLALTPRPPRR